MLLEDMTKDQLLALAKRWERAHCQVGICGSEYYADPERVFEVVRSSRDATMRALFRAKGLKSRAEPFEQQLLLTLRNVSSSEDADRLRRIVQQVLDDGLRYETQVSSLL